MHLSATAFGGGVAEINYALIPLMADAGLDVEWRIIKGADEFFGVTKTIHNALQGDERGLTEAQKEIFRRYNAENAEEFEDDYDFVIVHDPQPASIIDQYPTSQAHWIWRCHIDLSTPNRDVVDFLGPGAPRPPRLRPCAPASGRESRPRSRKCLPRSSGNVRSP